MAKENGGKNKSGSQSIEYVIKEQRGTLTTNEDGTFSYQKEVLDLGDETSLVETTDAELSAHIIGESESDDKIISIKPSRKKGLPSGKKSD